MVQGTSGRGGDGGLGYRSEYGFGYESRCRSSGGKVEIKVEVVEVLAMVLVMAMVKVAAIGERGERGDGGDGKGGGDRAGDGDFGNGDYGYQSGSSYDLGYGPSWGQSNNLKRY